MNNNENERAKRIAFMIEGFHLSLSNIYEKIVDREYDSVTEELKTLIKDLKTLIKIIEDDDF